jgi:hypothetical protein
VSLNIEEGSARQLMSELRWDEHEQDRLPSALWGSYEIPTEGTFEIASYSSGEEVCTCEGIHQLLTAIGTLDPGVYRVLSGDKKVIIYKPDEGWRLFVRQMPADGT